ncbi:MAG: restriction endonuclease [Paraclostridium sordellii]
MLLTNKKPTNWKMLQDYVAKYFNEAGYSATTPKNIELSRGEAEIDVYVETNDNMNNIILCECKYWSSNIPQEKIHAFRTIVTDSGANLGLFITTRDFQIGAQNAALYSNIKLVTWDEFLNLIKERWIVNKYLFLCNLAKPLSIYTDPFDIDSEMLSKEQLEIYNKEVINHILMTIIFHQCHCSISSNNGIDYNSLLKYLESKITSLNQKEYNFTSIEDFFEYAERSIKSSILFFENLFGDYALELNKKIF